MPTVTFAPGGSPLAEPSIRDMDERIAPAPPGTLGPLARVVAWVVGRATIGEPPRVFTTLGRHRRLFRSWLPFAATMLLRTRLPRADVELVVLRTAHNCASSYEWAQHVALARRVGLDHGTISAVADWQDAAITDRQRLLLSATDELHRGRVVTTVTWGRLVTELDEREVIELCMLVGHYEMLAMALNSLGVQPERSALAALDANAQETVEELRRALDAAAARP
jgi:alkylhydroperoxidase family enzyme